MIALYVRQSVERENSVSIETQLDYCRSMLRPDERETKIVEYIDEGCSGGNTNRSGFQKMMRDIQRNSIQKVIVYKLDRISRSLNDFVGILQIFKEHGVEFVSSQESFDTSTPYGDLILKILMVFAEFERTSIINRVRDAYAKRTDMGLYMGGRQQYGFELQETTLKGIPTKMYVPIPEAVEQLQYMFEVYAQGQVSLRQLQANLLEKGMKPTSGQDWTTAKLSALLRNPVYGKADSDIFDYFHAKGVRIVDDVRSFTGKRAAYLYGKTTHDKNLSDWSDMKLVLAQHEGIIPSEIWLRCQYKLEKNRQVGNSLSNKTSWLSGKLVCEKCGHTMTTIKSQRPDGSYRRYFNCTGRSHKKICSGTKTPIYADDIENIISQYIAEKLKDIGLAKRSVSTQANTQLNQLKLQLKELELQEEQLGDLLISGQLNQDTIQLANRKAETLKKKKQKLLEQIGQAQMQDSELETVIDLSRKWKKAKYQEKKAVAGVLIRSIVIKEDGSLEVIWNI